MEAVEYEQIETPDLVEAGEEVPPQVGEDVPAPGSLRAKVQAARARRLRVTTKDIEIPGTAGTLWGTFRAIDDFKERARIEKRWQRVRDEEQRALDVSAELLRVACQDLFVPTEEFREGDAKPGDRVSLNMKLGVELAVWLGPDVLASNQRDQVTDHEAVFLIFPSTVALANTASELHTFSTGVGVEADEEAQGE